MLRAVQRVDAGGGIVRFETVEFSPTVEFGNTGGVPAGGTLALLGAGNVSTGLRVPGTRRIIGASVQVNVVDALRGYNVSIRVGGVEQATLPLPVSSLGAQTELLNVPLAPGDIITVFMVRTSGSGASTFSQMRALLLVA